MGKYTEENRTYHRNYYIRNREKIKEKQASYKSKNKQNNLGFLANKTTDDDIKNFTSLYKYIPCELEKKEKYSIENSDKLVEKCLEVTRKTLEIADEYAPCELEQKEKYSIENSDKLVEECLKASRKVIKTTDECLKASKKVIKTTDELEKKLMIKKNNYNYSYHEQGFFSSKGIMVKLEHRVNHTTNQMC